jgi:acetyltransferase-like isoleucine patch superfamily enzyme
VRGVELHPSARVARSTRFDVAPGGRVVVGPGVTVGAGCRFEVAGVVLLGAGTVLGERCVVLARERVVVGARCRLGDEVVLLDTDARYEDVERPVRLQGVRSAPVVVEDDVVLGAGAALLRGVRVAAGAVVGARAVVTRDVPAGAVAEGAPARVGARQAL